MTGSSRIRAYLELARLSNAPTVCSNALAGAALGVAAGGETSDRSAALATIVAAFGCTLLYVAGMALNDLVDRSIDSIERPNRPIPSGRIGVAAATTFVAVLIAAALGALSLAGLPAIVAGLVLCALIVVYDLTHAATVWAVVLMGACRGMVYVVAAIAVAGSSVADWWIVAGPALCLAAYVAGFSVIARREAAAAASSPRYVCGRCGYPVHSLPATCPECGATLDANRPGSAAQAGAVRPGFRRVHVSLLLPILLLAAFAFLPIGMLSPPRKATYLVVLSIAAAMAVGGSLLAWLSAATRLVTRDPPRIGPAVTMWIAAISLFDAYLLLLLRNLPLAAIAVACFVLTRWGQRRIAGT